MPILDAYPQRRGYARALRRAAADVEATLARARHPRIAVEVPAEVAEAVAALAAALRAWAAELMARSGGGVKD